MIILLLSTILAGCVAPTTMPPSSSTDEISKEEQIQSGLIR